MGALVSTGKAGRGSGGRLPYPESVRPLGEASTALRVLPTFQPGVRTYARCQAGGAVSFTGASGSDKHVLPYEKVHWTSIDAVVLSITFETHNRAGRVPRHTAVL
eukprot:366157-Chlamydomonas_euryale.AAC.9